MIGRLILIGAILLTVLLATASPALAFNPFSNDCNSGGASSSVCSDHTTGDPIAGSNGLILKVTRIVAIIAGAASVIAILTGSIRMIIANGDPGNFAKGRTTVIYALIGLAMTILATTIVGFFVSKL